MSSVVTVLSLAASSLFMSTHAQPRPPMNCWEFTGIGDGSDDIYTLQWVLDNIDNNPYINAWVPFLLAEMTPLFTAHETSIQGRIPTHTSGSMVTLLSAYESVGLDAYARKELTDSRRRCETYDKINGNTDLFSAHRRVAWWYLLYFNIRNYYQLTIKQFEERYMIPQGLQLDLCDGMRFHTSGCNDQRTPWGLAWLIASEEFEYSRIDGWNALGELDREYNRIPYSDYRGPETRYIPRNDPWDLKKENRWQPLLDDDRLGFLFHQEHVTPHVGYTGKSILYSDEEFCERSRKFKKNVRENYLEENGKLYDIEYEIDLLLERMKGLTELDKVEIEFYDAKTNLGGGLLFPLVTEIFGIEYYNTYEFMVLDLVYLWTVYESVLAVWKEKVDYDRVRPTSIIKKLRAGEKITTYAGTTYLGETYGTQEYGVESFETYIQTMPHAEFPSGSSCICSAFASAMIEYWGTDDTTLVSSDGLRLDFASFSSIVEPLSTPSTPLSSFYLKWTDTSKRCGETRLLGGMHFSDSVPAGEDLCRDIGIRVVQSLRKILSGEVPDYIVDTTNPNLIERDCYPRRRDDGDDMDDDMDTPTKQPTEEPEERRGGGDGDDMGGENDPPSDNQEWGQPAEPEQPADPQDAF